MTNCQSTEGRGYPGHFIIRGRRGFAPLCRIWREILFAVSLLSNFLLPCISWGQPIFSTNSLPCQFGQYNCCYFCSNINVSGLLTLTTNITLGPPGSGPFTNIAQTWDLSAAEQPGDSILRTDIVPVTNGGYYSYFPSASYAEQDTFEPSNVLGWQYYGFGSVGSNTGRIYYGLDEPVEGASPEAVFTPSVIDIPATVQFNQTWSNSTYWLTLYFEIIVVSNNLSYTATVDAYGTLYLPQIGSVPALRVHQVNSYALSELTDPPTLIDLNTNDYYYWLVPGLGVAAQVEVIGNNALYPTSLPYTNTLQRMYFANYFTNSVSTNTTGSGTNSSNLQAQLQGGLFVLNWITMTNCTNYRVDFTGSLASSWSALGFTSNTSWTDSMGYSSGFYRVVGNPP